MVGLSPSALTACAFALRPSPVISPYPGLGQFLLCTCCAAPLPDCITGSKPKVSASGRVRFELRVDVHVGAGAWA